MGVLVLLLGIGGWVGPDGDFEGWVGLAQGDMGQGLSRKVKYLGACWGEGAYKGEGRSGKIGWN